MSSVPYSRSRRQTHPERFAEEQLGESSSNPSERFGLDGFPRHNVIRSRVILREAAVELGFHLVTQFRLMPLIQEPIPELVHQPDTIYDGPGIDFYQNRIEIHRAILQTTKAAATNSSAISGFRGGQHVLD
jgi:hypothetical protein